MSDDADTLVVTVEPEDKAAVIVENKEGQKVEAEASDPAVADLVSQYKELEDRDKRSRERAAEAQRIAQEATQRAHVAETKLVESNIDTVDTALAAAKSEVDQAKKDIKTAGEAGDFEAQAEAYAKLATASAKMLRFDEAKSDLERTKETTAKIPPQVRQQVLDPVEAYVAGRSKPTQDWLRSHPEWVTDTSKNKKLTAAHYDADANGIEVDSPEYFEHVEKFIGLTKTVKQAGSATNVTGAKRMSPPVAPGSAFAGGSSGGGAEVRLSQREAAAATDGTHVWNYDDPSPQKKFRKGEPIGIQEFARRKKALTTQGAYDRVYVDQ